MKLESEEKDHPSDVDGFSGTSHPHWAIIQYLFSVLYSASIPPNRASIESWR